MSTSSLYTDATGGPEWKLRRAKFKDLYQRVTSGTTTKLQRCRHYLIIRSRELIGVTNVSPENREIRSTFTLFTGPDTQVAIGWIGGSRNFICTDDDIVEVDSKTGHYSQTQTWEHYSKWADVPDSDFGTTADEDPSSPTQDQPDPDFPEAG